MLLLIVWGKFLESAREKYPFGVGVREGLVLISNGFIVLEKTALHNDSRTVVG